MTPNVGTYILNTNHEVILEEDLQKWSSWMIEVDRVVDQSDLSPGVSISTVFLGTDMSFGPGPPLVFETMVFGGELNDKVWRYSTWEEAKAGHIKMIRLVKTHVP